MQEPREMELFLLWLHRHKRKQSDAAKGIKTHKNYLSAIMSGGRPLTLPMAKKLEAWMRSEDPKDFVPASRLLGLNDRGHDDDVPRKKGAISS